MRVILFSLVFLAAACGNKNKAPETGPAPDGEEHATDGDGEPGHDHKHDHPSTPEVTAFHDVLAPLWHDETADRQALTCKQAGELLNLSDKIEDAGMPAGAVEDWDTRVAELMASIMALMDECSAGGADFDAKFTTVHENFHKVMEGLPQG